MEPVKTFSLAGYTASIYQHTDTQDYNPRTENDNLGTLTLFPHSDSRCYIPSDKESPTFEDLPALTLWLMERGGALLPVYVWADWIPEVSCNEGSGEHLGYIYCTPEVVADEYGTGADATARALNYLRGEVAEFAAWVRGEVYYILVADNTGRKVDEVYGLIGMDTAEYEAAAMLAAEVEHSEKTPAAA